MWHSRPPRDPPPFLANTILNFHFDYWNPSLTMTMASLYSLLLCRHASDFFSAMGFLSLLGPQCAGDFFHFWIFVRFNFVCMRLRFFTFPFFSQLFCSLPLLSTTLSMEPSMFVRLEGLVMLLRSE